MNKYFYARVSSEEQGTKGLSIDAQKERAKSLGIKPENVYIDVAKSGGIKDDETIIKKVGETHTFIYSLHERQEFNKLLNILTSNKEEKFLYFTKADRLSRDVAYQDLLFQTFERYNTSWESLDEPYISISPLTRRIMSTISHQELDSTKQRVDSVRDFQFKQGISPTRRFYGYEEVEDLFVPIPEEASIIRQIYALHDQGKTNKEVSIIMGKHPSSIKRILSHLSFYKGYITYKGETKKGTHKPIL